MSDSEPKVLAKRVLKALPEDLNQSLTVTLMTPQAVGDDARSPGDTLKCQIDFETTDRVSKRTVTGKDWFDLIQNCLVMISSELFLRAEHEGQLYSWEATDGTGFPSFPALRILEIPEPHDPEDSVVPLANAKLKDLLDDSVESDLLISQTGGTSAIVPYAKAAKSPRRGEIITIIDGVENPRFLVVTRKEFNTHGYLACCPVIPHLQSKRAAGFIVDLGPALGVALCHRPTTFHFADLNWETVGAIDGDLLGKVLARIRALSEV